MLKTINESYSQLLKSKEFENKGLLCGFFLVSETNSIENSNWQIDFYNKDSDTITSYIIEEEIKIHPKSEIFKEENTKIEELNLNDLKIDFSKAIKKANNFMKKSKEEATKIIVILQKQKFLMWNISFITNKFNILNIRINATNGKIIEKKLVSLISFKKE